MNRRATAILFFCLAGFLLATQTVFAGEPPCPPEPALDRALHRALLDAHKSYEKKNYAEALRTLDNYAAGRDRLHHRLYFMRGILNYQLDRKKTSCRDFQAALKAWPCFAPALRNLANVQYELGRYKAAALTAGRAYRLVKPRDPDLAYMAAVFHLADGQPKSALPYLKGLLERKSPKKSWFLAMVRARMDLKQWLKAEKVLAPVLRRFPNDPSLWRLLASLELRLNRHAKAAAALEVAVHLEKPRKGDWRTLAELHRAAGAHAKSARYFARAFGANPDSKQWLTLSRTYLLAQDLDRAVAAAKKARQLDPCCLNEAFLAELLLRKRAYRQANQTYLAAAEKAKKHGRHDSSSLAMQAGYCALRSDDLDRALKAFQLAHNLAPQKSNEAKKAAKWCREVRDRQQDRIQP